MKVLLTGASGFVGKNLVPHLRKYDLSVIARKKSSILDDLKVFYLDINDKTDYSAILSNIDVVIHCAARAHVMKEGSNNPLMEYRKINTLGTLNLASQAAELGVKRFVFLSSIKVNGEMTCDKPFSPEDKVVPEDDYALSKYEAENGLSKIAAESSMDVVTIRPPLIYGPGVKGNFYALIKLLKSNIPLPLGMVKNNRRSLLGIDNLIDFILLVSHTQNINSSTNNVFLVSDGNDLSTYDLICLLAESSGKKPVFFNVPISLLRLLFIVLGKKQVFERLCGSLQVDISKSEKQLGWKPKFTVDEQFRKAL